MELDKHQWSLSPNLITSTMAGGGNYPGKSILLGPWPFDIALESKVGSYVIFLMKTCSIVYMLQIWQTLNNNQMFLCVFYGEPPTVAFPSKVVPFCLIVSLIISPYLTQFFFLVLLKKGNKSKHVIFSIRNDKEAQNISSHHDTQR